MVERDARVWVAQVNCACVVDGSAPETKSEVKLCTVRYSRS